MPAIIFDFDGVIADSELLSNSILAQHVSRLGRPTSVEQSLERYMGRRSSDVISLIEQDLGRSLPLTFLRDFQAEVALGLEKSLLEVSGASAFIRSLQQIPNCIASSSPLATIVRSLRVLGLQDLFGDRVLSADMVRRGKPFPDIFLLAAEKRRIPRKGRPQHNVEERWRRPPRRVLAGSCRNRDRVSS